MSPIQQMLLGAGGAVAKKTYIDDVFSNYLWTGTGSARSINNGIDTSGEGALVWMKKRVSGYHTLYDTTRGVHKPLYSNLENSEANFNTTLTAFNNNGFSLGDSGFVNASSTNYTSWTFRKAPGWFTVCTWTGNDTNQSISHDLGCVPGMIICKSTTSLRDWAVYHRGTDTAAPEDKYLKLNEDSGVADAVTWNDFKPTSTTFQVGGSNNSNENGQTYIAYLFAGESFQDSAVQFDGGTEGLTIDATSDFHFGTDDFTIECFTKRNSDPKAYSRVWAFGPYWNNADSHGCCFDDGDHANKLTWANFRQSSQGTVPSNGRVLISTTNVVSDRWYHVAVTRKSGVFRLFIDGKLEDTNSSITTRDVEGSATNYLAIGKTYDRTTQEAYAGEVSNFRVVNGQALYIADFNPPGSPLTQTSQGATSSNVKLLCCNQGTATGSTVTPGTISEAGSVVMTTARVNFAIDPDACIFGESGTKPLIACGSYSGSGSSGLEVKLGWEPQFLMIKRATGGTSHWYMWDNVRGIFNGSDSPYLKANESETEDDQSYVELTSTGFRLTTSSNPNHSNDAYIYLAIRRPDGYVGKPPSLGTDVFAMDTATNNFPAFDSNFIVDMSLNNKPEVVGNWELANRLTTGDSKILRTNADTAEYEWNQPYYQQDSNAGWGKASSWESSPNNYQSWMWKRHAGFDVVAYTGKPFYPNSEPHSLNAVPEMIWVKRRSSGTARDWMVYHKGLNGGTNPEQYGLVLNSTAAEVDDTALWQDTAPTSTHFTLGGGPSTNSETIEYIAMLFASVDGISSVGSYSGSNSDVTISLGFTPRFFILKRTNDVGSWQTFDSIRGMGSGNDEILQLNDDDAQVGDYDVVQVGTNQMVIKNGLATVNTSGNSYIYYAHA